LILDHHILNLDLFVRTITPWGRRWVSSTTNLAIGAVIIFVRIFLFRILSTFLIKIILITMLLSSFRAYCIALWIIAESSKTSSSSTTCISFWCWR